MVTDWPWLTLVPILLLAALRAWQGRRVPCHLRIGKAAVANQRGSGSACGFVDSRRSGLVRLPRNAAADYHGESGPSLQPGRAAGTHHETPVWILPSGSA